MIRTSPFQTRARTVDHLGREQIADCPTAISELWKNAFDAYARRVELNIYPGDQPVASITDDGHGMSRDEFSQHWLVVGTDAKATVDRTPVKDRNGLRLRPRQGQKGIGRLSCANLGPLLLLVSKRKGIPFIATLVDWRLFENPFLNLSDVHIPIAEFSEFEGLFEQLPDLVASLSENINGAEDEERRNRILSAWKAHDELHTQEHRENEDSATGVLSREILNSIASARFTRQHLQRWPIVSGDVEHGTALLVSGINYDLRVHLDDAVSDSTAQGAKDRFFETLSSFVDPIVDPTNPDVAQQQLEFSYAVRVWTGNSHRLVVGSERQFEKGQVDALEHRLEGRVDAKGTFRGRVKAFGEWLPEDCVIEPPSDLSIPHRRDSELGPFDLYIASMEFVEINSTHSKEQFRFYTDLARKYAGFMIFRDGLRVLPYGRTDNDFFDIESRRSKNVGREFWNHRQMFGRLSVTRARNPNLKDKAGREGLLDNRAAKTLKVLMSNILRQSALRYFGSDSKIRKEVLPQIFAENERQRADEARNRLRQRHRKIFRSRLRSLSREIPIFAQTVETYAADLQIETEEDVSEAQRALEGFREQLSNFRLSGVPENLGQLEDAYREFQARLKSIQATIVNLDDELQRRIEQIDLAQPTNLLRDQLSSQDAQIKHRIYGWSRSINALQEGEQRRIQELITKRIKLFRSEAIGLIHKYETRKASFLDTSNAMNALKQRLDDENTDLFVPYIGALESLSESIDLEHLATFGMEEVGELRTELERLNSLAQLGIAVEIAGHELQSFDDIIAAGLKQLPEEIRSSDAVKDIELGYEGLTDQLRFLSPLRLAGHKVQEWITGAEIFSYVTEFFKFVLIRNRISCSASDSFLKLRVFDQRSRIYPVFINLLNNSIYWLSVREVGERRVVFDIADSEVVISDNGPGVSHEDLDSLFSLFFTRKVHGGRGVGLYLCRANLTAAGHTIRYESETSNMPLPGANFLISFRGAEFSEE